MHRTLDFCPPSPARKESNVQKQKNVKYYCHIYILLSSFCYFYEHETIPQYSRDDVITTWRCILGFFFFFSLFGIWFLHFTASISLKKPSVPKLVSIDDLTNMNCQKLGNYVRFLIDFGTSSSIICCRSDTFHSGFQNFKKSHWL